ncbi:MAG: 1-acyl-sn-glycerol-3-phosphate acyltransferase [Desulfobacterota bacterium]|jgi:1-acyl-sn-glycerol-3-phosphate acyltransferase|nr:1-acyl-sn-glycerol-3-phosphate acyltransferase [Thermodesulfobacteriota bacterium]
MKIIFYYVLFPLYRPFYLISVIVNTFLLGSLIILLSPLDRSGRFLHYIGKFWSHINIYLAFCRVSVLGMENIDRRRTYVVLSNHQSLFDVWVLIAYLPLQLRWVIKNEIRKMPVFGYALERMGHIYVDRDRGSSVVQGIERAVRKVKEGTSVVFFPEGTRSEDGRLGKFRRGGFVLAQKTGYPILPITINGSRFVLPKNTLDLMPGKIEIHIKPSIEDSSNMPLTLLVKTVQEVIQEKLDLSFGKRT